MHDLLKNAQKRKFEKFWGIFRTLKMDRKCPKPTKSEPALKISVIFHIMLACTVGLAKNHRGNSSRAHCEIVISTIRNTVDFVLFSGPILMGHAFVFYYRGIHSIPCHHSNGILLVVDPKVMHLLVPYTYATSRSFFGIFYSMKKSYRKLYSIIRIQKAAQQVVSVVHDVVPISFRLFN